MRVGSASGPLTESPRRQMEVRASYAYQGASRLLPPAGYRFWLEEILGRRQGVTHSALAAEVVARGLNKSQYELALVLGQLRDPCCNDGRLIIARV